MKHVEVVCALIENDDGKIFCCQRGPGRDLVGFWEFPGGKVEAHETHEQTIIREIEEELGSLVKPLEYIGVSNYEYKELAKPFSITMYGYRCKLIKGDLKLTEHTAAKWCTMSEMKKMKFAAADKVFIK
ncbi:MAG: (deoxy)nucleoside triphosphate pyrophosphohydrolase [Bacilli bacterium]|jgi:8-oxo-dGTP diphosphatase|nr:(deoxy)nucleoside triphosphate pyrophosphohydrolase [Bacilli bacterium]MDD3422709.1 (deoxy)nucleoside triphosphate pyrophosphohydrolase [Bacilli bacterium]MDD4066213.1 (deoxy)nucleoside triphosphate pyrophosphohydrolase [Bacilli bacterium]